MVDGVVREWLREILDNEVTATVIGKQIRKLLAALCVNAGLVQSSDLEFLQHTFNILISLFESIVLQNNATKTETMACIPGRIRMALSQKAYTNRTKGHNNMQVCQTIMVNRDIFRVDLARGSFQWHL